MPGTSYFVNQHPEKLPQIEPARDLKSRIERLNHTVMLLPKELFGDFYQVLVMSKGQYQTSRIIVWTSALTVLGMLCGLMLLFQRWVLYPVRLLQRGCAGWPGGRLITRSSSTRATRCKTWPRRSTT